MHTSELAWHVLYKIPNQSGNGYSCLPGIPIDRIYRQLCMCMGNFASVNEARLGNDSK